MASEEIDKSGNVYTRYGVISNKTKELEDLPFNPRREDKHPYLLEAVKDIRMTELEGLDEGHVPNKLKLENSRELRHFDSSKNADEINDEGVSCTDGN